MTRVFYETSGVILIRHVPELVANLLLVILETFALSVRVVRIPVYDGVDIGVVEGHSWGVFAEEIKVERGEVGLLSLGSQCVSGCGTFVRVRLAEELLCKAWYIVISRASHIHVHGDSIC